MSDQQPVDAEVYAAHLDRLDRIGREALAAEPAQAIQLVREASDLVGELLPMHRSLMAELAEHRSTLQAACDELAAEAGPGDEAGDEPPSKEALDRLDGVSDPDEAPF